LGSYYSDIDMGDIDSDMSGLTTAQLLALLNSGGGGTDYAAAARERATIRREDSRAAAQERRRMQQAGLQAQQEYGSLGQSEYDTAMGRIAPRYDDLLSKLDSYYTTQGQQATGTIDAATQAFLDQLKPSTAYTDLPDTALAAPQQALGDALGAYGATGALAATQATDDTGYGRVLADLAKKSQGQMGTAQQDYLNALRTAGVGGQTAAKQGLTNLLASLQGQERSVIGQNRREEESQAERDRREMIMAGIRARMAGQGF
jgi:hypothetical protein